MYEIGGQSSQKAQSNVFVAINYNLSGYSHAKGQFILWQFMHISLKNGKLQQIINRSVCEVSSPHSIIPNTIPAYNICSPIQL